MWYRLAQKNLTYQWQTTPEGDAIVFHSGKAKNGLPAYPTIFVLFQGEQGEYFDIQPISEKISENDLIKIIQTVQNVLFKYPPGWLTERAGRNFQVQVAAKISRKKSSDNYEQGEYGGVTPVGVKNPYVTVAVNEITEALDHEIAHVLDEIRYKPLPPIARGFLMQQKDGTYMAPSEYGTTNNTEAHSTAYELLAKNGINFRLPYTSKENIDQNRLLDFVAEEIRKKGYKTQMSDFADNIQLRNFEGKTSFENVNNLRISTLVGAFQNAIDKFKGDKNAYGFDLIKNKQKINDIVAFVNKSQTEFFVDPVSQDEIKNALDYIREKLDKKSYYQTNVEDQKTSKQSNYSLIDLNFLPRKLVEYLKGFKISETYPQQIYLSNQKTPLTPQQKNNVSKSIFTTFKWEDMIPVDEKIQDIYDEFRFDAITTGVPRKGLAINRIFNNLINFGGIFPNMRNQEEFLFFDFKITPQGYTLDSNNISAKIKNALTKEKNLTEDDKLNIEKEIIKMINTYASKYKELIEYKDRDPKNPFPIEFLKNQIIPKDYLSLAKKAVDSILTNKSDPLSGVRTGQKFMQIYNSQFLNQNQKQELFNYYTSKRRRSTQK